MSAQLLPDLYQVWRDANGNPLAGGSITSYQAGTTTPLATYTDFSAGTPNTNPIVLDSAGAANVWLGTSAYKFVIKDSLSNVIRTIDNVSYINPGSITKTMVDSSLAGVGLLQNVSTKAFDVQTDGVTTDINGSNQVEVKPGAITASFIPASSKLEVIHKNTRDLTDPGSIKQIPQYEWTTPSLLAGPTGPGAANVVKWSPNGEFLALGSVTTPYIDIYQVSGSGGTPFTKLANPGTLPTGAVSDIAWSPCGDFLACAHTTTPSITIYQRSGNTFTKLSDPAVIPTTASSTLFGTNIAFSPNSDFLVMTYVRHNIGGTPFNNTILYERSGTTFTCITDDGSAVSTIVSNNQGRSTAWSPDSYLLGILDSSTNLMDLWTRADNVFTSATPPVLTTYAGNIGGFAFSPDGNILSVALTVTPFVLNFKRSGTAGTTFTVQSNPSVLPPGITSTVSWSANSEYLFVGDGSATSPYMTIYQVTNPTTTPVFTRVAAPGTPPAGSVNRADWSPTKQFLAVASGVTPYIQIYKTASALPGNALLWSRGIPNV